MDCGIVALYIAVSPVLQLSYTNFRLLKKKGRIFRSRIIFLAALCSTSYGICGTLVLRWVDSGMH